MAARHDGVGRQLAPPTPPAPTRSSSSSRCRDGRHRAAAPPATAASPTLMGRPASAPARTTLLAAAAPAGPPAPAPHDAGRASDPAAGPRAILGPPAGTARSSWRPHQRCRPWRRGDAASSGRRSAAAASRAERRAGAAASAALPTQRAAHQRPEQPPLATAQAQGRSGPPSLLRPLHAVASAAGGGAGLAGAGPLAGCTRPGTAAGLGFAARTWAAAGAAAQHSLSAAPAGVARRRLSRPWAGGARPHGPSRRCGRGSTAAGCRAG